MSFLKEYGKYGIAFMIYLWLFASDVCAQQLKEGDVFFDMGQFQLEGVLPESLRGKVVMVDFWASWCGPCKYSFPVLNKLAKRYGKNGLVIIAVSVDENPDKMKQFLKENPVSFTVVRDEKHQLVAACGIISMPTSFLIDCDGVVRFIHNGFKRQETEKELIRQIEELIACVQEDQAP